MASAEAGPRIETGLVYVHGLAALATLFISVAFGIVASIQLLAPDTGAGTPWLGWGRIRYAHTQGIMPGWASMRLWSSDSCLPSSNSFRRS